MHDKKVFVCPHCNSTIQLSQYIEQTKTGKVVECEITREECMEELKNKLDSGESLLSWIKKRCVTIDDYKNYLCDIFTKKSKEYRDSLLELPDGDTFRIGFDIGYNLAYAHALEFAVSVIIRLPIEPSKHGDLSNG